MFFFNGNPSPSGSRHFAGKMQAAHRAAIKVLGKPGGRLCGGYDPKPCADSSRKKAISVPLLMFWRPRRKLNKSSTRVSRKLPKSARKGEGEAERRAMTNRERTKKKCAFYAKSRT